MTRDATAVWVAAALAGTALLVAAAPGAPPGASPYRDGPPVGFSGGFGEGACDACHFEAAPNQPPGNVSVLGVPERYAAGKAYPLTVVLTRPGMAIGGFQLTARFEEDGSQAGCLSPAAGEDKRMTVALAEDVQYAYQRLPGSALVAPDTARWTVLWTAPARANGTVLFHVAANAANEDDTAFGDYVYTAVGASRPSSSGAPR
jgi:hypothetical protein